MFFNSEKQIKRRLPQGAPLRDLALWAIRVVVILLVVLLCGGGSFAYSVLTHEQIVAINTESDLASAEAVKLEEQERPEKEANERKKEADDLEVTREKNQRSFRP